MSSLVYDEELSTLSEGLEGSENTWADRNENRPETQALNLSNGSVMTLTGEGEAADYITTEPGKT